MSVSCENCTKGYILPGEPEGQELQVAGLTAYFRPAPSTETSKSRAIILLTDVFGLPLKNCKIMADNFSKRLGCDVWVPDMFNAPGRPTLGVDDLTGIMPDKAGSGGISFMNKLRLVGLMLPAIPKFYANRASVVDARVTNFMKQIQEEKKYEKVGAVGYCFGASVGIRLGSKGLFNSVVLAHPGGTSVEEIRAITIPASWACAEEDMSFGPALRKASEEVFAARKGKPDYVDYEFVDYAGTVHGFAARPNLEIPEVKESFERAFEQTVAWFDKTL
ncbi:hypothetical protein JAAARDRAFT_30314 [Jaapia argillacea MUCL 33604]|uniref:Dienelactone hydrolase domain-containing protein n=1 Tax=Jaapia argillacea MUCL 33604 TaxID=933084 RepID=A0A067Q5S8_9AGAM|nr:hypothetical protein JAAARDRAFT_30314 [Jaapia argillacea MUCL 33604]